MIKFIKKHKLNFISYLFCAFAMALFTIISFSCKTYAYTIDSNGNLIGDNLLYIENGTFTSGDLSIQKLNGALILNGSTSSNYVYYTLGTINFNSNEIYYISGNGANVQIYLDKSPYYNENAFTGVSGTYNIRIQVSPNSTFNNSIYYPMVNLGNEKLEQWEPYGVWYSENNYNAVIQDNEDLQEQIDFRDNSSLLSGIKTTLDDTNLKIYNSSNLSLTQMLSTTPFHIETISFPNEDYNYNMEYCNIDTFNAIMNNNGEFSNGDTLTNDPTLLYTFKTPLFVSALTFSRNDTSGTRYIDLYFTDNTSTELLLTEGSENNRLDFTWVNTDNKYLQYISTTAEIGFNCVYAFTIPNSNQIYTSGYANGYTDGMYDQYQNDASSIQNANQAKQAMYSQGYAKGIEDASKSHDLGWSSLFFAMADTPFKVVSNVLGFELFGLNLFSTFIGMITVFGVVYLLKKFI